MTRVSILHRAVCGIFFIVLVFFAANYYLGVGLIERHTAGRGMMLTVLVSLLYFVGFARQLQEMVKQIAAEKAEKDGQTTRRP